MIKAVVLSSLVLLGGLGSAEIEKKARVGKKGIDLYWWPKLKPMKGWVQDTEASYANSMNILVPKGTNFSDAVTVIYGRAEYKSGNSLAKFIEDDRKEAMAEHGAKSAEAAPAVISSGQKLKTYDFTPVKTGNWERVAYLREGDYTVVFALSSRTQKDYNACLPTFLNLLKEYKK